MSRKLFALVAATFLLSAALSGGTTVAMLSDGATVTTTISVGNTAAGNTAAGNAPIEVNATVDDPGDRVAADANGSSGGNQSELLAADNETELATGDGVSIALEPANGDETVGVGNETTYDVVVTGADENIASYGLTVELSNSSMATFEAVTYPDGVNTSEAGYVAENEVRISASSGDLDGLNGSGGVVVASVTVEGENPGKSTVTVTEAPDLVGPDVYPADSSAEPYNVTGTSDGTVVVTDSG